MDHLKSTYICFGTSETKPCICNAWCGRSLEHKITLVASKIQERKGTLPSLAVGQSKK